MPTLKFVASKLGRKVNLLLIFKPPQARTEEYPLVWRRLKFPSASSKSLISITLPSHIGFYLPQHDGMYFTIASNWQPCSLGQVCTIVDDDSVSPATKGKEGVFSCVNSSKESLDIGLGFLDDSTTPRGGAMLWRDVKPDEIISTPFVPHIMIFEAKKLTYKDQIYDESQSSPVWSHEVNGLDEETILRVAVDPDSGRVFIAPEGTSDRSCNLRAAIHANKIHYRPWEVHVIVMVIYLPTPPAGRVGFDV